MVKNKTEFSALNVNERKEYLKKYAPSLLENLKKDINELPADFLLLLFEINQQDILSRTIARQFADNLSQLAGEGFKRIGLPLSNEKTENKKLYANAFQQLLFNQIKSISDGLYAGLKEGKGVLFNGLLATKATGVLETILEFEKKTDQLFPGASKIVLQGATTFLTLLITAYCPAATFLIKTSGIMEKANNFLAVENLENTIRLLHQKEREIEENKILQDIFKTALKANALGEKTSLSFKAMQNLELDMATIEQFSSLIEKKEGLEFFKQVGKASELLPISEEEAQQKFTKIKISLLKNIDEQRLPEDLAKEFYVKVENNFRNFEKTYQEAITLDKSFFSRIVSQQQTCSQLTKFMQELDKEFIRKVPGKNTGAPISKNATLLVKDMQGNVLELFQQARKTPAAIQMAKKLGLNLKVEIALQKITAPTRQRG